MIKIRRSLFETNSSSGDRYDDYDDNLPSRATANQAIRIVLEYDDNTSDYRLEEIAGILEDLGDDICSICDISEDMELEFDTVDGGDIYLMASISAEYHCVYDGYAGDRYEPPSNPEYEFSWNKFPYKSEISPRKSKMKEQLLIHMFEIGG